MSTSLVPVTMYPTQQKELLNVAYVHALAAQAGLNHKTMSVDDDSVDLTLCGRGYKGKIRNPHVELQLKCTSQDLINGNVIKYPLKKKNYDDLRGSNVACPKYLVVMLVPKNLDDWLEHPKDSMLIKHCCYWVSIKDMPALKNGKSITIDVPLANRLTTQSLKHLMLSASNRTAP